MRAPLRERPGDVLPLARHFLQEAARQLGKPLDSFSAQAAESGKPAEIIEKMVDGRIKKFLKEVTLLGQNVNAYQGQMDDGEIADLALLIHYVAAVEGIDRIRYTTSHPVEFSDALIQAHAEVPELVKYLHLPVQSGSDRVLAGMKRNHTALEYKSRIRKLKAAVCQDRYFRSRG